MSKITYQEQHIVLLDGKQVGVIKGVYHSNGVLVGYQYWPTGGSPGEVFGTKLACMQSLES